MDGEVSRTLKPPLGRTSEENCNSNTRRFAYMAERRLPQAPRGWSGIRGAVRPQRTSRSSRREVRFASISDTGVIIGRRKRCSQLDVVGVVELAEFITPTQWTDHVHVVAHSVTSEALTVREMRESERPAVESFLQRLALSADVFATALAPGHKNASRRRLVLSTGTKIVAFVSWSAPQRICFASI